MKTLPTAMASSKRDLLSSSRSRRHFHWSSSKVTTSEEDDHADSDFPPTIHDEISKTSDDLPPQRRKLPAISVSRIKSVLVTAFSGRSPQTPRGLGPKVIGTLFGHRKGHVNFVFQREHNTSPVFFVELATPITTLVREMASGLVRIALECDKSDHRPEEASNRRGKVKSRSSSKRLLDEPVWRSYCNGKKCGFANKREPGPRELKILKAVEPISMGAGVLPGFDGAGLSGAEGEMMYMRAKFERVVGSRDSEAFYMMNPDCDGAPELSIYLLRV